MGITSDTQTAVNSALDSLKSEGKLDDSAYATVSTIHCTVKVYVPLGLQNRRILQFSPGPPSSPVFKTVYGSEVMAAFGGFQTGSMYIFGDSLDAPDKFGTKGVAEVPSDYIELDSAIRFFMFAFAVVLFVNELDQLHQLQCSGVLIC